MVKWYSQRTGRRRLGDFCNCYRHLAHINSVPPSPPGFPFPRSSLRCLPSASWLSSWKPTSCRARSRFDQTPSRLDARFVGFGGGFFFLFVFFSLPSSFPSSPLLSPHVDDASKWNYRLITHDYFSLARNMLLTHTHTHTLPTYRTALSRPRSLNLSKPPPFIQTFFLRLASARTSRKR